MITSLRVLSPLRARSTAAGLGSFRRCALELAGLRVFGVPSVRSLPGTYVYPGVPEGLDVPREPGIGGRFTVRPNCEPGGFGSGRLRIRRFAGRPR